MINMGLYYYEQDLHTSQEGLDTLAEVCTLSWLYLCVARLLRGIGKSGVGVHVNVLLLL